MTKLPKLIGVALLASLLAYWMDNRPASAGTTYSGLRYWMNNDSMTASINRAEYRCVQVAAGRQE